MGLFDSFYDEDSECPRCHAKIKGDWQTKCLQSLLASWRKGDFLQYHKYERIPEEERKKKYGDKPFAPFLRRTEEYRSDAPLLFNGEVPVHTSCNKCEAWLEACAKIVAGHFTGIVEAEADGEEKELNIMKTETTAKTLREEFERRLAHLQESCNHEKKEWRNNEAPLRPLSRKLVCIKCEKTLGTKKASHPSALRRSQESNLAKLQSYGKNIRKITERYIRQLSTQISVKQAILTGSRARGSDLEDSDVDLIIVSDDFSNMPLPERLVYLQKNWKARVPLEAFGYTTSEFQRLRKNSSYVKDAVRHGISLVT
jgi:hypothetical protein